MPQIEHAPGYDLYRSSPDDPTSPRSMSHEAGYDAFMTGAAFARLLRVSELLELPVGPDLPPLADMQPGVASRSQAGGALSAASALSMMYPSPSGGVFQSMPELAPHPNRVPSPIQNQDKPISGHATVGQPPSSTIDVRDRRDVPFPPLRWAEPWRDKIHPMRLEVPFLDLAGPDPVPERPWVYHIANIPLFLKTSELASRLSKAGLGR